MSSTLLFQLFARSQVPYDLKAVEKHMPTLICSPLMAGMGEGM